MLEENKESQAWSVAYGVKGSNMNNKEKPKNIGAIWSKQSSYGEYLSIQVEIDGVKHNFTAFLNKYYEEGGKKPKYNIAPPREHNGDSKPQNKVNEYQQRIDLVNAEKAKLAKARANDPGMSYNQPSTIEEEQFPF